MAQFRTIESTAPALPDFHSCDAFYGQDIQLTDCVVAWNNMLTGGMPVRYYVGETHGAGLPYASGHGTCYITVEKAGPALASYMDIIPNVLRRRAGWVIEQCVGGLDSGIRGLGGFVTLGLIDVVGYVFNPAVDVSNAAAYPASTSFLTVTVSSNTQRWFQPGNLNPAVPLKIGDYHLTKVLGANTNPTQAVVYGRIASLFRETSIAMTKGGSRPWWQFPKAAADEMTYECDASLGSPSEADCSHIEWSELLPDSDSLHVGPGAVTFLHSNTCYVAISAAINLVLTWAQIRTALTSLFNICVQNPILGSQGGRAYYGPQPPLQVSGRKERMRTRKRQDTPLSGLNVLPQGANITVFKQVEPWVSNEVEVKSCTWLAVLRHGGVERCHG